MTRSERAGLQELPFRAQRQIANAMFPSAILSAVIQSLGPFLNLTSESDADFHAADHAIGQSEREVPVLAVGFVLVGGSRLELELTDIHRVRIINRQRPTGER
jgi:hypothetical protein